MTAEPGGLGGYTFPIRSLDRNHCVLVGLREGPFPELGLCPYYTFWCLVVTFPGSGPKPGNTQWRGAIRAILLGRGKPKDLVTHKKGYSRA